MKIEGNYQYSKPNFIEKPYGWVQHIPFAFYLIERLNPTIFVELGTHSGNSYFSFCQAVEELKFDTKCYAVDTWEGDEHANFYDKEVFQRVKRINAENFSRNSSLLKMTFDDALTYFSEGSVDLLHIDGLHTYKAVKHDFETWLPKMSKNGVMIFHDTNVRERGFGVWKFFEEVREMYPSFDFLHGNGLGVLCVGEKVDKGFSSFISSPENQADTRNLFSTLGNRILVLQEKEDLRKEVDAAKVIQKDSQKILEKVNLEKEKSTRLASQLQDHKIAIEKKNEKIVEIENKIKSEKEAINKLLNQLNEYKNTVANKNEKIGKLDLTLKKFEDTIAHKNSKITLFEEKIQEFKETVQKRNSKIEVLLSKIEDLRSSIDSKNDRILIQQQKIGEFDRTVAKRNDKIEKLEQRQIEIERLLSEVQEKNNALIQVEEALRIEIEQKDSVIQSRERNSDNLNQLLQAKNSEICEIGKENKHYQEKTVQQQKEILLLLQEVKALKSEIGSKSEAISELELKSQLLGNRLEKTSENVETLTQKSNKFIRLAQERKERIIAYKLTVERREDKIEKLSRQVEQFRKEARSRSNQQEKLVQKLDHAKFVIKSLTNSFSWKITMPLRFIGKVIRFIFGILVLLAKITLFTVTFRFGKISRELRIIKQKRVVEKSGLFDIDWYLMRYPDVRKAGIDPIIHYLKRGAIEGRNPSSKFNTKFYLEQYGDIAEAKINPLVHYIQYGKKEGRKTFEQKTEVPLIVQKRAVKPKANIIKKSLRNAVLFVIHDGGGGMVLTSFDLFKTISNRSSAFMLVAGKTEWTIYQYLNGQVSETNKYSFKTPWKQVKDLDDERIKALDEILESHSIGLVHIRVLLGTGPLMVDYIKSKNIPVVLSFHDFSAVCPNIHLINNGQFCFGNCNTIKSEKDCRYSRSWFGKLPQLRPEYRNVWSDKNAQSLNKCNAYIVTSEFTKKIILKNYPNFEASKFHLIEHGRELVKPVKYAANPSEKETIDIVFFGALNEVKGIKLVLEIMQVNNANKGNLHLHVIGEVVGLHEEYADMPNVTMYGKYERKELEGYIKKIRPSFALLPSICYETFSHTLTESWLFGIPPIGTSYGAIGERIMRQNAGWVLDPLNAQEWYDKIVSLVKNKSEYEKVLSNIENLSYKSLEQMTDEYYALYCNFMKCPSRPIEVKVEIEKPSLIDEAGKTVALREIKGLRNKMLEFGFVDRAYGELLLRVQNRSNMFLRSLASWELVLWHANLQTKDDALKAIEFLKTVNRADFPIAQQQQIALVESECYDKLDKTDVAATVLDKAMQLQPNLDLVLAMSNLATTHANKLIEINKLYSAYNLSPIELSEKEQHTLYDRLQVDCSSTLSEEQKSKKVTIIIPAYNAADTIHTSIDSLLHQTYDNIEIIIADDCSTDDTAEIVEQYIQKDSRIKLVKTEQNSGPYVARNMALDIATGDFITCNDSDDWSHAQKIEYQVNHLNQNPDVVANISQWARITEDLKFYRRNNPGFYIQINLSSLMFRKEQVLDKLGYWDSVRFGADTEFHKRLMIVFGAENIVELPPIPLSFARLLEGSLTGNSVFGYPGFPMGARKEYRDSYVHFHANTENLRYSFPATTRLFPIPDVMNPVIDNETLAKRNFDLIFVSDFRVEDLNIVSLLQWVKNQKDKPIRVALVHLEIYGLISKVKFDPTIRELIDGEQIQMLVYGDEVACKHLIVGQHKVLIDRQIFLPTISAQKISVVVDNVLQNMNPDLIFDELKQGSINLKHYFGSDGQWFVLDPKSLKIIENKLDKELQSAFEYGKFEIPFINQPWKSTPIKLKKEGPKLPIILSDSSDKPISENVILLDVDKIDSFSYSNPKGVAIVMPCIDTKMGINAAEYLQKRAGMDCLVVVANDTKRQGFIKTLNQVSNKMDVAYVVYLAQDAYPGRNWLKTAFDNLEKQQKGLLAFNDGKWNGKIASFGMVRKVWAKKLYGNMILFEGYKAHKADNEITVIAKVTDQYIYDANSVLIEVDFNKDAGGSNQVDDDTFKSRFLNGFDGVVSVEKVIPLAKEYSTRTMKLVFPESKVINIVKSDDSFVLYRIIGNDLYPRHKKGQSRENLQFILENEEEFDRCEKRFVINRIVDKDEEREIISLLQKHNKDFLHLPFDTNEYARVGLDNDTFDFEKLFASNDFQTLHYTKKDKAIAAAYRLKNNYIMNNNGARNSALIDGISRAKWVLPFDGNCFLTPEAWNHLVSDIQKHADYKYIIVPMARITDNADLLNPNFAPDPVEEPQIVFRSDADHMFDERFCYGRRPKVELLWRLGVPGKWDNYPKDDIWDLPKPTPLKEKLWATAGWVARLYSGNKEQEQDSAESAKNRVLARVEAIISTIEHVDEVVHGQNGVKLSVYRSNEE